jgi:hypothetical protein
MRGGSDTRRFEEVFGCEALGFLKDAPPEVQYPARHSLLTLDERCGFEIHIPKPN